jgi:hypothetical protein
VPNNEWAQFPLLRGHPADEVEDFSLIGKRRPGPWWSYLLVIALLAGAIRLIIVLSDAFGPPSA